jgi:hypothetical protein
MKIHFYNLLIALLFVSLSTTAQTTLNGGEVTGTLTKAGSPYTITADLTVPVGKSLTIEPGVEMYFDQHVKMTVYGLINAEGTASDSIIFTASNNEKGWYGIDIRKRAQDTEEFTFSYCRFSYGYRLMRNSNLDHGVLRIDSVAKLSLNHCVISHNKAMRGTGLFCKTSDITINECIFSYNQALDTSSTFRSAAGEPGASGIYAFSSNLHIANTEFSKNESYASFIGNDDLVGRSMIWTFGGVVRIEDCIFSENKIQDDAILYARGSGWELDDSLILTRSTFYKNTISDGAVLFIDPSDDEYFRAVVTDCLLEENLFDGDPTKTSSSTIYISNSFGGTNEIVMERCSLINNENIFGIFAGQKALLYFNNGVIIGQQGAGVFSDRNSNRSRFVNSIIANNLIGFFAGFRSNVGIVNCTVAYNGGSGFDRDNSGGVYFNDDSRLNMFNSIITHNRAANGKIANLVAGPRFYYPGLLHSSLVEGGIDSTFTYQWWDSTYLEDNVKFDVLANVDSFPIEFVKPPAGVGPDYASLDNDFHIKQSCVITPSLDIGQGSIIGVASSNFPLTLDPWNSIDMDGNPRIQCADIDLGPYEMQGEKFEVNLNQPWQDMTLCSDDLLEFSPGLCGSGIQYKWQSSSDNSTWTDLSMEKYENAKLLEAEDDTYYRVLTYQEECNARDTFGGTKLSLLPSPYPNLGTDTSIYRSAQDLVFSPGVFKSYEWNDSTQDINATYTLTKDRYASQDRFDIWVKVTAENGCTANDTIRVQMLYGVGISENKMLEVKLYPNPTQDFLHLERTKGKDADLIIYGLDGRIYLESKLKNKDPLDVSTLMSGTYVVVVYEGDKKFTGRFVKE